MQTELVVVNSYYGNLAMGIFSLAMPLFLSNGHASFGILFLVIGMSLMGFTFRLMAALLPELFPTEVRYSGASLAYKFLASIVGATIAATLRLKLTQHTASLVGRLFGGECFNHASRIMGIKRDQRFRPNESLILA